MVGNEGEVDGKEEKSWINLFSNYYGGTHINITITGMNIDTHLLSSTFSFLRSGYYFRDSGDLYHRTVHGRYWSLKAHSDLDAHFLGFVSTWLYYQDGGSKGYGMSLR